MSALVAIINGASYRQKQHAGEGTGVDDSDVPGF